MKSIIKKQPWLLWGLSFPAVELLRLLAKGNPYIVERYYSAGVFNILMRPLVALIGWVQVSIGELLVLFLVLVWIQSVVKNSIQSIRTKAWGHWIKLIKGTLVGVSIAYGLFFMLYGVHFYRVPLGLSHESQIEAMSSEDLAQVLTFYVARANESYEMTSVRGKAQPDRQTIFKWAKSSYADLPEPYGYMAGDHGAIKGQLFSDIQVAFGYTGMFFPITGEALVNRNLLPVQMAFTAVHELAHQRGIAREDEANYIGFLAAVHSDEPFMHYAAYIHAIQYVGSALRQQDRGAYQSVMLQAHPEVLATQEAIRDFWALHYQPDLGQKMDVVVEANLTSHGETEGLKTYGQVTLFLIDYYLETGR